ncbi:MAG: hypothetical protein JO322_07895 [Candidatus Eremiobacteraeota bacterium]|nr:hypothetical protein [Candidatus Eremiobacteraeota bacterium]
MNAQTQYVGTNLSGGGMQSVTIDHQAGTFQVATSSGASASSGTFTTLPNGDLKFTVTSATDGTTIGSIAYVHEMANGAAMFVATNTTTPNPDGSSNSADFGVMTAVQSCPTSNATFPVNVVDVAGPSFPANVSSREAYATGTATLTGAALSFAGTSYTLAGTSLGASSSQPATCANSVFTDPTGGSVVYDAQGLVVVSSAPSDGMPVQTGNLGFRAPSQPYSLSALASQTYEMYSAGFITVNGITSKVEAPYVVTPGGASSLTGCPYVNFETNSAGTSGCTTITFNAQPSPGIVTGTATSGASTTPFVAAVGQINGKYVLVALSSPTSGSGAAVNLTLMQQ